MKNDIVTLSDRLVFLVAVNTGFVTDGTPDHRFLDFYRGRSSPKLHCAIVGNVVVPGGFASNAATPTLTTEPVWADLVSAIRAEGTLPGIQLATTWEGYVGSRKFQTGEASKFIPLARRKVESMGSERATAVINSFDLAASIAIRHGFAHIQIHAAHGYLLSLLADHRINRDANIVLDRLGLLAERLRQEGVQSSIRISLKTGDSAFDSTGSIEFQDAITQLPFDYVDISSGFYNIDKRLIYPARPDILAARLQESVALGLRHPKRSFILSGRALNQDWAGIPSNMHPGICRDLIANPKFLQEPDDGCKNHGKCHYYSRGGSHLTCARWTEAQGGRQPSLKS
ncbi:MULTISPECIES: hypothetical protein [unclassified Mesorhizobium]|uniref:oxidoreductase n=1 Tax=unclassified Mesorhizobium TaxID=325217 RepID=UPI000FCBD71D|nr:MULTISPECIES: hypothetical protein [unclassified Mesorhizobium]RUW75203.1 hypothetical protein EOA31_09495 [Mesorhizobium sp. M4B.F.Ca.ET.049.02.1.2]TGV23000.1 hypothetical protein EN786_26345 [Mesorhizobium sp. M4B.F.Ca.ET.143.01.1.1]